MAKAELKFGSIDVNQLTFIDTYTQPAVGPIVHTIPELRKIKILICINTTTYNNATGIAYWDEDTQSYVVTNQGNVNFGYLTEVTDNSFKYHDNSYSSTNKAHKFLIWGDKA